MSLLHLMVTSLQSLVSFAAVLREVADRVHLTTDSFSQCDLCTLPEIVEGMPLETWIFPLQTCTPQGPGTREGTFYCWETQGLGVWTWWGLSEDLWVLGSQRRAGVAGQTERRWRELSAPGLDPLRCATWMGHIISDLRDVPLEAWEGGAAEFVK